MRGVEVNWQRCGTGVESYVKVDGKELGSVRSIRIDLTVADVPTVIIECLAPGLFVKIDEAETTIRPKVITREAKA